MNVNISLSDDLDEFVKKRVASGRNSSASDVVVEALRLMERHQESDADKLAWLQNAYREGVESGDAGEFDFDEIRAEGRALLNKAAT